MVKIGGGGPKAPDTSGVQRAHESVMRSHEAGAQQAAQLGSAVGGVVDDVRQQGQVDAEQQARKDRLDVEMAKGDLEFKGEGIDRKVVPTEAGVAKQESASQLARSKAATAAASTAAYEMKQRLAIVKAGYSDKDGELNEDGKAAARNLHREVSSRQTMFTRIANGGPDSDKAIAEFAATDEGKQAQAAEQLSAAAQGTTQDMEAVPGAGTAGEAGIATQEGGAIGSTTSQVGGLAMDIARAIPLVRAGLDFAQLKYVVNTSGEMPDDVMMDSKAWQSFNSARNNLIAIMKSGVMMPVSFKNIKERNRFFNELAAEQVLSGQPAPGSMADPSMTEGVPAAGQPDDGNQQPGSPDPESQAGPGGYQFSTSRPNSQQR